MNSKNVLYAVGGLLIGLVVGFFAANNLNQSAGSATSSSASQANAPTGSLPSINNVVVKDQETNAPMMPQIAETLDKAAKEPTNFEAQVKAGDLYLKIENFQKALEFYQNAAKIKPDDYETVVKLGNTYFDSKQFEEAQIWYEKALAKKPDDFGVRTDLGVTFVERSKPDLERAIKEFETALKTNPKHAPTLYNLAIAYSKSGAAEDAQKTAQKLGEIDPGGELSTRLKSVLK